MSRSEVAFYNQIPFYIEENQLQSGRRIAKYEYPFRDSPSTEDLGRKARTYSIEGFVTGIDAYEKRNRLLAELENGKPGILIHPYLGELRVRCENLRVSETNSETRYVKFSITFCEQGSTDGLAVINQRAMSDLTAEDLRSNIIAAAQEGFLPNTIRLAETMLNSISEKFNIASDQLAEVQKKLSLAYRLKSRTFPLSGDLNGVINNIFDTTRAISSILLKDDDEESISVQRISPLIETLDSQANVNSDSELAIDAINTRNSLKLVVFFSIIEVSSIILLEDNLTEEELKLASSYLLKKLEDLLSDYSISRELYFMLSQYRSELVISLEEKKSLINVQVIEIPYHASSLTLAYELYGDISRESEIIRMNNLTNPVLIEPGTKLRIRRT